MSAEDLKSKFIADRTSMYEENDTKDAFPPANIPWLSGLMSVGGGSCLSCEGFGVRFDDSFPVCAFYCI